MAPSHDLVEFVRQAAQEMALEYQRIYARTREDPGTAGDEGEENWAELLRRWLPSTHHVVTKGRILASDGQASRQVDVLVLSPSYPRGLIGKKLYFAAGVLAAFECKTTLRPEHIKVAIERAVSIAQIGRSDESVNRKIVYGLLAHSAQVPDTRTPAADTISRLLHEKDQELVRDPRDCLGVVCVADLGTWAMTQSLMLLDDLYPPHLLSGYGGPSASYPFGDEFDDDPAPEPIGRLLTCLLQALGEEDSGLQPFAQYFADVGLYGVSHAETRRWMLKDLPPGIIRRPTGSQG
ncbi:DUF6602 domain-containing protein [Kribbella sp. NPDC051770]|uniref:DUF6602 domain-containing protein n=1 Tax=Kribbella sp. NPDC051770 TaxID=3155413 RepID=UPI0034405C8A